jgi:hypothetical protein
MEEEVSLCKLKDIKSLDTQTCEITLAVLAAADHLLHQRSSHEKGDREILDNI